MMIIGCEHWRDCGIARGGCCTIGAYHRPSYGVCLNVCEKYEGNPAERERMAAQLRAGNQTPPIETSGWGTLIKCVIHAVVNWIDRIPRRSRYRLGFVQHVLSCPGCAGRQRWLDRNVAYPRWRWMKGLIT